MKDLDYSLIVSVLALLLSGFATWRTHKLGKSQEVLNDLMTDREKAEALNAKKADMSANVIQYGSGKYRLKVFNKGKSVAHDVRLSFPNQSELPVLKTDLDTKFPISIEPLQSVELIVVAHMSMKRRFSIQLNWRDELSENNTKSLDLTI